ncbi:MAG: EF-P beta-lysylation protein EpmB [Gammaproteobacteria bacterium]
MIPRSQEIQQPDRWQQQLAAAVSEPRQLLSLLNLNPDAFAISDEANRQFRLRVPHSFVQRMRCGDSRDPLLRQVLPIDDENRIQSGYSMDPLEESAAMPVPGLLHKYQGRVLLTVTGACAIHCRYCFRRHFPYDEANPVSNDWQQALAYIHAHSDITEVILSGGDPLSLSDCKLAKLVKRLEAIPHIKRLRIHTRLPVVLPDRINSSLVEWLSATSLQKVVVLHINHINEIDASVCRATQALSATGATLLNQSVLLKGVNDSVDALLALSERLFEMGTLPYYLHQLDPVQGTAHFSVDDKVAVSMIGKLSNCLPGYLVPKLVRELAGSGSKTPLHQIL